MKDLLDEIQKRYDGKIGEIESLKMKMAEMQYEMNNLKAEKAKAEERAMKAENQFKKAKVAFEGAQ